MAKELRPMELVDLFIGDCLLPTTNISKVMETKQVYEYYKQYCDYAELSPVGLNIFGRCMANRFTRSRRKGVSFYRCELNPRVAVEGE